MSTPHPAGCICEKCEDFRNWLKNAHQNQPASAPSNLSMVDRLRAHATEACKFELDLTGAICNDAADEIERLTAALAACQTYDYRTLADEVERLQADLAIEREQLADLTKRWGAVVDDRERLRAALRWILEGYTDDPKWNAWFNALPDNLRASITSEVIAREALQGETAP